ncbi:GTP cyclohydrolase II RibA [Anaplasmataceae bacterium AB001_6]|nr:GTP cyclohydrolase II RibA [Anaplasmataceae bacterium AB001_6]
MSYRVLKAISDIKVGLPVILYSQDSNSEGLLTFPIQSIDINLFRILKHVNSSKLLIPGNRVDTILGTNFFSDISVKLDGIDYEFFQSLVSLYPKKDIISIIDFFEEIKDLEYFAINLMRHAEQIPMSVVCDYNDFLKNSDFFYDVSIKSLSSMSMEIFYEYIISKPEINLISKSSMVFQGIKESELLIYQEGLKQHIVILFNRSLFNDPVIRVHSSCYTGDLLESLTCDCHSQLHKSLQYLKNTKDGGILLYLDQEGRGIGLSNKIKCYSLQNQHNVNTIDANKILGFADDLRDFRVVTSILEDLGLSSVKVITNNPEKIRMIEKGGIKVVDRVAADFIINDHNIDYLKIKKDYMGHVLDL